MKKGPDGLLTQILPNWIFVGAEIIQRFIIFIIPNIILLMFFFVSIDKISGVNIVSLLLVLVLTPFPKLQRFFSVVLMIWVQVSFYLFIYLLIYFVIISINQSIIYIVDYSFSTWIPNEFYSTI